MALTAGTRFGPYAITGSLGAGGMGEVYRATDTSLKRDVAIKVLPETFAADADRLARFQREAEVLASLNHPNIAQIYGLERAAADAAGGSTALVMELIDGPTLADRIAQGPIPADEALHIAMQIVDALEAAHEKQIVHRDLKPANVKLRPDGTVKVLDFGIAKALDTGTTASGPQAPQLTTPAMTRAGLVLGTAAYMSPEQARGKAVDQRADVWAFGCVLYEMLTGQPAFGGEDVPITLARVLAYDADMDTIPGTISPNIRQTIELCLRKEPRKRLHSMGDVRLALAGDLATDASGIAAAGAAAAPSRLRQVLPVAAAVLVTAIAVGLSAFALRPEPAAPTVTRFAYAIPDTLAVRNTQYQVLAVAPDGSQFVYNTNDGLELRRMSEIEAQPIAGTTEFLFHPFFSADSASLAYVAGANGLKRIAVTGGAAVPLTNTSATVYGASWAADDTIFFGQAEGIYRVAATGGTPELVVPSEGAYIYGPYLLPDGDTLLFSIAPASAGSWDASQIVVQSLTTGERKVLISGGTDAVYVPTGHVVYAFENSLFGIAFDLETLSVHGGPVPLIAGVTRSTGNSTATANFGIAANGTLVYYHGATDGVLNTLVWVDRETGAEEPIDVPLRNYQYAQLSPDGTRIALDVRDQENDTWIWDVARKTLQRLTFDRGLNRGATWSPDGTHVAFSRQIGSAEEVYWQAADGSGVAEQLTHDSAGAMMPNDFSPDGTRLVYMTVTVPRDLYMVTVGDSAGAAEKLLAGAASEQGAAISPNGRWVAYQSDESGQDEVYVRPFPDVDSGRWQISTNGGTRPLWSRNGKELFYFKAGSEAGGQSSILAVAVEDESAFRAGAPEILFSGPYLAPNQGRHVYDVSLDDRRFLMIKSGETSEHPVREIVVVENWTEELKRLVPTE